MFVYLQRIFIYKQVVLSLVLPLKSLSLSKFTTFLWCLGCDFDFLPYIYSRNGKRCDNYDFIMVRLRQKYGEIYDFFMVVKTLHYCT